MHARRVGDSVLTWWTLLSLILSFAIGQPLTNRHGPYEPAEAVRHVHPAAGVKVRIVAHEPAIVDPVAMAFDDRGRMYVCEMPGYPNGGRATGDEQRGRVKRLEDRDGDGQFETVTGFAEGLRFPTSVLPFRDGLIVCNAPDILFLRDTDGDGRADQREVWYTGFDLANIQQPPNALQWGPGGFVHGMLAGSASVITCPMAREMKPVPMRNNGFRFKPGEHGTFQATSGGGQYGLTRDHLGNWFTCSNSQVCRQIVLPDELLRGNPDYIPSAVTADIDAEGTSIPVFRRSPFETWRVERTTRRRESDDNSRYPRTELVPGGYTSSTCGCLIVDGVYYACDPGNNMILRRKLTRKGSIFQSSRMDDDQGREFLASDDNWFRPTQLVRGPDGAIFACDFYREIIETPLSIPDDMKPRMNIESRGRGRIWRIDLPKPPPGKAIVAANTESDQHPEQGDDPWAHARLLCELTGESLVKTITDSRCSDSFLAKAATVIGRRAIADEVNRVVMGVGQGKVDPVALTGLAEGLRTKQKTLAGLLSVDADRTLQSRFQAAALAKDVSSVRLLAFAPVELARPALASCLTIDQPVAVRIEAVKSLSRFDDSAVTTLMIRNWPTASPDVRKAILTALTATPARSLALLAAVESNAIRRSEIDPARLQQFRNHPNAAVKARAAALFGPGTGNRTQLVNDYALAIRGEGDAVKGKALFALHCASCHRFDGVGNDVGPDLLAAVPGRSTRDLLTAILDPNREVDARYMSYSVQLADGRVLTGVIASESANGLTLRTAEGGAETLARGQVESLKSTGQSLMPEGLESAVPRDAMPDLLAYLRKPR